jgi:hypothetical protein
VDQVGAVLEKQPLESLAGPEISQWIQGPPQWEAVIAKSRCGERIGGAGANGSHFEATLFEQPHQRNPQLQSAAADDPRAWPTLSSESPRLHRRQLLP